MDTIFIIKINWTKLVMSLTLLCSMFILSTAAQTDAGKSLDAKSLTALVTELKGVVSRTETDEKNAALVAKKWDERKDLAGKTKKDVINLLFEDVKSVIRDPGTQYQISSIFSAYKQMPDESFSSAKTQSPVSANSKPEAVKNLIDLTFPSHPYVGIEEQIANLPGTKSAKEADWQQRISDFDDALKANSKLTSDQKSFVKASYGRLSKMIDKTIDDATNTNFPTERWIKESLQESYTTKFTVKELTDLAAYFQSAGGRQALKYIRLTNMTEIITGNGGKLDFTAADKAEHDKFAAAPLGKKFISAYITETEAYEQKKENAVRNKNNNADGFAILEPANLNNLLNKFVAENYKK